MFLLHGVFVLRGEIFPPLGSLRWMPGTRFARIDSRVYAPLAFALAVLAGAVTFGAARGHAGGGARGRRGRPRPTWADCSRAIEAAIAADFPGKPQIDDPFAGAVRGAEALDRFVADRHAWLAARARAADARPGHARRRPHGRRGGAAAASRRPRHRSPDRGRRRRGRAHRARCARCASITASGRWKASTASGRRCCRAIPARTSPAPSPTTSARSRPATSTRSSRRSNRTATSASRRASPTSTAARPSCARS